MLHYALGNPLVRALTLASRHFFDSPPDGFPDVPLGRPMPVMIHARPDEIAALDSLEADIAPFAELERVDEAGLRALCPALRVGWEGAVAGLVAVTPAAGTSGPLGAIVLGGASALVCYGFVGSLKHRLGLDDSHDVFGIHGLGGIVAWCSIIPRSTRGHPCARHVFPPPLTSGLLLGLLHNSRSGE